MDNGKPRVIKDYDKLPLEIQEQIKLEYPFGFSDNLIRFTNKDGLIVSALPFETEDKYYMVRMTVGEAIKIVEDDDDFDDDGILKDGIKEEYENKYADEIEEEIVEEDDDFDDSYGDDDDDSDADADSDVDADAGDDDDDSIED
jgi:hypothetical protein